MNLLTELRRRNVFRVGTAYLVLAWLVIQVTDTVAPALNLPEWTLGVVVWIGIVGFPFVLIFSCAFELTPEVLKRKDIEHTRGASYHPMTQGNIERYHRSMKNVVKLEHYYYRWELEKAINQWEHHCNHERYHESLDNVTPADVFGGRRNEILDQRALVKVWTMTERKIHNLRLAG